jgi:hypothetical protein
VSRTATRREASPNDDVVLELREICSFGQDVVIVFAIENRARPTLDVGSVEVKGGQKQKD